MVLVARQPLGFLVAWYMPVSVMVIVLTSVVCTSGASQPAPSVSCQTSLTVPLLPLEPSDSQSHETSQVAVRSAYVTPSAFAPAIGPLLKAQTLGCQ